jgi:stage V sporulation protein K
MEFERGGDKKKRKKGQKTNVLSSMSQVYLGNPGTGKTTVARIMAGFLYQYGYIKKPQTIEVDGNFFNGLSRGESSERAKLLIQKARGGVLFIDEAYALLGPDQDQSVIATLVAAIENYRDDTVFIFAGYTKETLKMLDSNPGCKSRIKYILDFPDYSRTDMQKIFLSMAHDLKFKVSNELLAAVGERTDSMRRRSDFGNARTVRTLLDQIINEHAVNCRAEEDPEKRMALTLADLPPA